jgi:DNA-binding response OmpR family regulator
VLDAARRTVSVDGHPVVLAPREFDVLHALLLAAGRVLPREQIEQQVYGWGQEVESNAIEVHIHHLRRKLSRPGLIQTVRGVGYAVSRVAA